MILVDASVVATVVGGDGPDGRLARQELRTAGDVMAPDLVDVETVAVLRKLWTTGLIDDDQFADALTDLGDLDIRRVPVLPFMRRAYELRADVTAYDAVYVALAEALSCELLTPARSSSSAEGAVGTSIARGESRTNRLATTTMHATSRVRPPVGGHPLPTRPRRPEQP